MNYSIIGFVLGWIIKVEGIFLLLPVLVAFIYQEKTAGFIFLACAAGAILLGTLMSFKKPSNKSFYAREGFITVALGWIVMSLIGALPFYISGEIPFYLDAFFEIVSGFTTTGASILPDVEALSKCMLFWRSFSHWLGGMGVLVFVLTILPLSGGESLYFMKAESPGPSVSKLVPKMRQTAGILYIINSIVYAKSMLTMYGLLGAGAISFGVMFIIKQLAQILVDYVPYLMIAIGVVVLIDAFLSKFVRYGSTLAFVIMLVAGALITTLGFCLMFIGALSKIAAIVFGCILIVASLYTLISLALKKNK